MSVQQRLELSSKRLAKTLQIYQEALALAESDDLDILSAIKAGRFVGLAEALQSWWTQEKQVLSRLNLQSRQTLMAAHQRYLNKLSAALPAAPQSSATEASQLSKYDKELSDISAPLSEENGLVLAALRDKIAAIAAELGQSPSSAR